MKVSTEGTRQQDMWIRTGSGRLYNIAYIRYIYAETEDGEHKVTANLNNNDYENLRGRCKSLKIAQQYVDYIHTCLSEGVRVCNLQSDTIDN